MPKDFDTLTEDAALVFAEQGITDYDFFDYLDTTVEMYAAA